MTLIHKISTLAIGGLSVCIVAALSSYGIKKGEPQNTNPWGVLGWEDEKTTIITEKESNEIWGQKILNK